MTRVQRIVPIKTLGSELRDELAEIRGDLQRIQAEARTDKDWKKELAVLDRRLKLVELHVREVREHSTNVMQVNFDVSAKTGEAMATAFLARQRILKANGERDGE
jgi:hypothetical protein